MELIHSLSKLPAFGIFLTVGIYIIALQISKKTKIAFLNPVLVTSVVVILILLGLGIKYEDYNNGGIYITFLIGPSTVALVVNLYKNLDLLKRNFIAIFVGVISGVITAIVSVFLMTKLVGLEGDLQISLVPKSLTTAIGVSISEEFGGISAITVFAIILTGIIGAVMSPFVFRVFGIRDRVAKGIGLGTASHAVGTSKAIQMGEVEGAMSGLSIALSGFISVILIPIFISLFK
ncbi:MULTISPECIES: LrgB family protein [Helcococcus]|uniref:LrgB family protein n=1 Tax=Helcococcus bovis TaxID=3153252 RepID=A0ABW9F542_9FIRM